MVVINRSYHNCKLLNHDCIYLVLYSYVFYKYMYKYITKIYILTYFLFVVSTLIFTVGKDRQNINKDWTLLYILTVLLLLRCTAVQRTVQWQAWLCLPHRGRRGPSIQVSSRTVCPLCSVQFVIFRIELLIHCMIQNDEVN